MMESDTIEPEDRESFERLAREILDATDNFQRPSFGVPSAAFLANAAACRIAIRELSQLSEIPRNVNLDSDCWFLATPPASQAIIRSTVNTHDAHCTRTDSD
jgi:hypothetical protein